MKEKYAIQESQYHFPYHYIPRAEGGVFKAARVLRWGYEYAAYINYVAREVKKRAPASLLDVGCGDGRFIHELTKEGATQTSGIDTSDRAIAFARAFNPENSFYVERIEDHKEVYDCLTCIEVFEHIPPEEADSFVSGIAKCLCDKGTLILSVPSDNVPVSEKHYRHFSLKTLEEALSHEFKIEKIEYLNKKGFFDWCMRYFITNRFYVLNQHTLLNLLFKIYTKFLLFADERTGKRIVIYARKK